MSETKKTLTVKLYGNLGRDPELRSTHEQVYTRAVYDSLIDDAVEREFHKPGREFRTFTLAVNAKDAQGQPVIRWHRCIDWRGLTATYRKGDREATVALRPLPLSGRPAPVWEVERERGCAFRSPLSKVVSGPHEKRENRHAAAIWTNTTCSSEEADGEEGLAEYRRVVPRYYTVFRKPLVGPSITTARSFTSSRIMPRSGYADTSGAARLSTVRLAYRHNPPVSRYVRMVATQPGKEASCLTSRATSNP